MNREACEELAQYIEKWLEQKKHRTLKRFAAESKVSYSTVRRIAQRENPPTVQTALSVLRICDPENMSAFISKHWPEYSVPYHETVDGKAVLSDDEDVELLSDPIALEVLLLIEAGYGRDTVTSRYGSFGCDKLDKLIGSGRVVDRGDKLEAIPLRLTTVQEINEVGITVSGEMSRKTIDNPDSTIGATWQGGGLSNEGLQEARAALNDFAKRITEVRQNYPGDKPFSVYAQLARVFLLAVLTLIVAGSSRVVASGGTVIGHTAVPIDSATSIVINPAASSSNVLEASVIDISATESSKVAVSEDVLEKLKALTEKDAGLLDFGNFAKEIYSITRTDSGLFVETTDGSVFSVVSQ